MSCENRLFAYAKTKTQISFAVTAKLISAFVFAIRIVQSLYYLHPKFQASSHLLWLYSLVCVGPGRKPEDQFSQNEAQIQNFKPLVIFNGYTGWFVSDLVRNPKDRFSCNKAHIILTWYCRLSGVGSPSIWWVRASILLPMS